MGAVDDKLIVRQDVVQEGDKLRKALRIRP